MTWPEKHGVLAYLMGYTAIREKVALCLAAIEDTLNQ